MNNNEQNTQDTSKEEQLLKAIFDKTETDDGDDDYPSTMSEKISYSEFIVTNTLGGIGKVIHRLNRLNRLIAISGKDGTSQLPDIIANNELRMALEPLLEIESDIKEVSKYLTDAYNATRVDMPKKIT